MQEIRGYNPEQEGGEDLSEETGQDIATAWNKAWREFYNYRLNSDERVAVLEQIKKQGGINLANSSELREQIEDAIKNITGREPQKIRPVDLSASEQKEVHAWVVRRLAVMGSDLTQAEKAIVIKETQKNTFASLDDDSRLLYLEDLISILKQQRGEEVETKVA